MLTLHIKKLKLSPDSMIVGDLNIVQFVVNSFPWVSSDSIMVSSIILEDLANGSLFTTNADIINVHTKYSPWIK